MKGIIIKELARTTKLRASLIPMLVNIVGTKYILFSPVSGIVTTNPAYIFNHKSEGGNNVI